VELGAKLCRATKIGGMIGMVSNRKLYEKVFCRYIEKGYNEQRADYIATRVVNRQRSHLRGQQELGNAGWSAGNLDIDLLRSMENDRAEALGVRI